MGLINKGWYGIVFACEVWCVADDQTHIQLERQRRKKNSFFFQN